MKNFLILDEAIINLNKVIDIEPYTYQIDNGVYSGSRFFMAGGKEVRYINTKFPFYEVQKIIAARQESDKDETL